MLYIVLPTYSYLLGLVDINQRPNLGGRKRDVLIPNDDLKLLWKEK